MRNSSLVEWVRAENSSGLKHIAEAAGGLRKGVAVGERSIVGRSRTVRTGGRTGSAYADTSSDKAGEKPARRKPKGSWGRLIRPGLVGS